MRECVREVACDY